MNRKLENAKSKHEKEMDALHKKHKERIASQRKTIAEMKEKRDSAIAFGEEKVVEERMSSATTRHILRQAKRQLSNEKATSEKHLKREKVLNEVIQKLKSDYDNLQEKFVDVSIGTVIREEKQELERKQAFVHRFKKERPIGRHGGGAKWPVSIVQRICEQLVNGTPPSAIPANILSMFALDGIVLEDVPSVSFC